MVKLNSLQYPLIKPLQLDESFSIEPLKNNDSYENMLSLFKKEFGFDALNTFSFTKEGFLAIMIELDGLIAISKGECEAIIQAGLLYEKLGNKISWIGLNKDGQLNYKACKNLSSDFFFVSSYIMDTFVQTSLKEIKQYTSAKIISNCSASKQCTDSDLILFDAYKLCGYGTTGVLMYSKDELNEQYPGETDALGVKLIYDALSNQKFESKNKNEFIANLKNEFNDDLHFFVDPESTLPYTLHFGLKGIKAREIIRTLSLSDIYVTNGEGCSLGLARPSRIIQEMGYEESQSRWALSINFIEEYDSLKIETIVKTISKKYRQIKALS